MMLSKLYRFFLAIHLLINTAASRNCWYCYDQNGGCPKTDSIQVACRQDEPCWSMSTKDDPNKMQIMDCPFPSFLNDTGTVVGECNIIPGSKILDPLNKLHDFYETAAYRPQGRPTIVSSESYNVCACTEELCKMEKEMKKQKEATTQTSTTQRKSGKAISFKSRSEFVVGGSVALLAYKIYGF